jgi:hypothetical protein
MILDIEFEEITHAFNVEMNEITHQFTVDMGEVYEVSNPNIPSNYGKITYNQDKSIIVS